VKASGHSSATAEVQQTLARMTRSRLRALFEEFVAVFVVVRKR
jgi:hypothetical protein